MNTQLQVLDSRLCSIDPKLNIYYIESDNIPSNVEFRLHNNAENGGLFVDVKCRDGVVMQFWLDSDHTELYDRYGAPVLTDVEIDRMIRYDASEKFEIYMTKPGTDSGRPIEALVVWK